jgi:hypothetical protein
MTHPTPDDDSSHAVCASCLTSYLAFHKNQAYGCDATCTHLDGMARVSCGYGSAHDLMVLSYQQERFPPGEICDTCLERAVREGFLLDIDSYAYQPATMPLLEKIRQQFPSLTAHDLFALSAFYPASTTQDTPDDPS